MNQLALRFDGRTYDHSRDGKRLHAQLNRVKECMKDGQWRTLGAISDLTGDGEASVSARLRDLRKPKFGSMTVDRRYLAEGLWEYRVV